jgi:hypothetical protein
MLAAHANDPAAPETPRRRFRKLRIAFSFICGIACVLLLVLWARSYWKGDGVSWPITSLMHAGLESVTGRCIIRAGETGRPVTTWEFRSVDISDAIWVQPALRHMAPIGFAFDFSNNSLQVIFPHWLGVSVTGLLCVVASVPCLGCRFSLRSLLIATTLIAAILGVVVYAMK